MISFITYGVGTTLIALFFHLDYHNNVIIKWKKFRKINRLVSSTYKGSFRILWISFYMVIQSLWISIIQYFNNTIVQLDANKYLVTYIIKGNTYKIIVKNKRGPRNVLLVSDETETDISDLIFPYLGPEENFHCQVYTPNFFGKKELIFELSNGCEKIFKTNENIVLN
jgi:hypothetical protein